MVLGQEHVPQADLAGLNLKLLHDGGVGLPSLLALTELSGKEGFGGNTFLLDEFFDLHSLVRLEAIGCR